MALSEQLENSLSSEHLESAAAAAQSSILVKNKWLIMAALFLIAIVAVVWGRTVGSYFLADDFGEVSYVYNIISGNLKLLWSTLTGNYMQIQGMNVYRPWLLITILIDCLLYRAEAWGYYLTNLLHYAGSVVLLSLVTRFLTREWSGRQSSITALCAAGLFAVNPLHCESVSWMVGRVDIVCCFYYLMSIALMLTDRRSPVKTTVAVICFWLALMTKEMAVGLPVVLSAYFFLFHPSHPARKLKERLEDAAKFSLPFWLSLVAYFAVRYLALGTLVGGYVAGFGASQSAQMFARWVDVDTLKRLFFPLNAAIFPETTIYSQILTVAYSLLGVCFFLRVIERTLPLKLLLFCLIWAATCAAPIFQLWGLGYNLEGARFFYFLTVPISVLFALAALAPVPASQAPRIFRPENAAYLIGLTSVGLLAFAMARIAFLTNAEWVHAGKEVRKLKEQAISLAQGNAPNQIALLGLPKDRAGAHLILNGETFRMMMEPPFVEHSLASQFRTFEPVMFSPTPYINSDSFDSFLRKSASAPVFVWRGTKDGFEKLDLKRGQADKSSVQPIVLPTGNESPVQPYVAGHATATVEEGKLTLVGVQQGDGIKSSNLSVNPLDYDYMQFDARIINAINPTVQVRWLGADSSRPATSTVPVPLIISRDGQAHVMIRLSHYWQWYAAKNIKEIELSFSACEKLTLKNMRLTSNYGVAPRLEPLEVAPTTTGVFEHCPNELVLSFNANGVDRTKYIQIDISKPNYFFDNFQRFDGSCIGSIVTVKADKKTRVLDLGNKNLFPKKGYYQMRAFCLDAYGQPVGDLSEAVTLKL